MLNQTVKPLSIALFFITLLFTAQTCRKQDSPLAAQVFKHWVHSFEDDTADTQVYRPASYKFPLAEGRESFEIKQNGDFIQHSTGAADNSRKFTGKWTYKKNSTISIQLQDPQATAYQLHIIELSDTLLKVHKTNK